MRLQIKLWSDELVGLVDGLAALPWRLTFVLDLPARPDELTFGGPKHRERLRWAARKAVRLGMVIRPAETEGELRAWYKLYLETMRWHMVPPRSYRFFRACWELLRPHGLMRLLLAEQHSAAHCTIVGGSIFLMSGQTVFYAFNGWSRRGALLHPNDAILWKAIHDACQGGFRQFDFGEVSADNEGLATFKRKWGAEARQMYHYYYPAPQVAESDPYESVPRVASRPLKVAWHAVPLRVTAPLGSWIYRRL